MPNIAIQRLHNQQLVQTTCRTPGEVVAWLGAVQAQDYAGAKWALGLRLPGATDADVEQAFVDGTILRTHVMRPTWHFVTPADIRWILALTAPRVNAVNAHMYRRLELDDALFRRSNAAIAKSLEGGKRLTRLELAAVLEQVGIAAEGVRLGYIVHRAELDAVVCSGARRGKQFTYALLDERAPHTRRLPREDALAELTRRYFTSHAPATVDDFAWWSGLTKADIKAGLQMAKSHLEQEVIEGKTYWFSASTPPQQPAYEALLLPTYDEFVIGYTDRSAMFDASQIDKLSSRGNIVFDSMIVFDGQVVGSWRRTISKGAIVIESALLQPFTAAERDTFAAAARRYGEFFGMPVTLI
jgi:Winged helix DNA-binding domain